MDPFMHMRTKINVAEATRQILNKSIDLLHKLSHKKVMRIEVNKELNLLISQHFFSCVLGREVMDDKDKLQLELILSQAYEVTRKVEKQEVPLYEGIMMMNKVVMGQSIIGESSQQESEQESNHSYGEEEADLFSLGCSPSGVSSSGASSSMCSSNAYDGSMVKASEYEAKQGVFGFYSEEPQENSVEGLMGDVVKQKELLQQSILKLNSALQELGFQLTPL